MKVITSVTLLTKDAKGQDTYLAPGEHNLPAEVASDAIERGFAVEAGKASPGAGGGHEPSLLDGTIPDIVAQLDGLTAEQLDKLAEEERAGKTRAGVLKAIEDAKADLAEQ
jgi:hypothetical protein